MIATSKKIRLIRPSLFLGLALAACFLLPTAHAATTAAVGSCTNYIYFPTIQTAVNSVSSGSTIEVCPGTYQEQVTITKKLTLIGTGATAAVIVPPAGGLVQNGTDIFGNPVAAQIFVASKTGSVTIKRLTVDGAGNNIAGCGAPTLEGIYFQNTAGTIAYNTVRNQYQTDYADFGGCQNGLAINVESTTSSPSVTVSYNSVRAYQKNGITATGASTGPGSPGPVMTITYNYIVGLGATAMNWPVAQNNAGENGIQIGFGASGTVNSNTVNDNIWSGGAAASGILIYASPGVTVSNNEVNSAQFGIAPATDIYDLCPLAPDGYCGTADGTIITGNKIVGTQIADAIDACSNSNTIKSNTIYGSAQSGVHFDDSCTTNTGGVSGNSNTASGNTINEACTGVLLGTGTGNSVGTNTFYNVSNSTLAGDSCPAALQSDAKAGASSPKHQSLQPAPYAPFRQ